MDQNYVAEKELMETSNIERGRKGCTLIVNGMVRKANALLKQVEKRKK